MQTAQFKMHHANAFYAAVSHVADLSGNKCDSLEGSKAHVPVL